MPRAIEILDVTVRRLERGEMTAIEAIDALLAEELTLRENRRIKIALMMARLSTIKTLAGFDFSFQPSLDKNRIMALAELEFINRSEVVHFLGPPGTGKSHLSLALGVQAVKAGRSVYFTPLSDLISALAKAEREGTLREKIRFFCRFSLLIVDEIGYLPVVAGGGNLFFQLVNARYEKGAMILTSNRGFAEWGEVFGDPVVATALLDRLLHHAIVIQIEGSSYRLRQHADLVPDTRAARTSGLLYFVRQTLSSCGASPTHEMHRPKICERFGSATRLKAGSHPIGGRDSVVTTGGGTFEVRLGTCGKRSPLWIRSSETMSACLLRAAPAPVTAAAKPVTARQLTTPIRAIFLAARRLTRSAITAVLFVSISDSRCLGE